MAYPNYFNNYNGNYFNQPNPQIVNNGFVMVRSEAEARSYPVAYGNSVTFKDENSPFIYTKTCVSQLQPPVFEKYRLVKEETKTAPDPVNIIDNLKQEIVELWAEINSLKENKSQSAEVRNNGKYSKRDADVQPVQAESDADAEYAV